LTSLTAMKPLNSFVRFRVSSMWSPCMRFPRIARPYRAWLNSELCYRFPPLSVPLIIVGQDYSQAITT